MTPTFWKIAAAAAISASIAASASGQQFHRPGAQASAGMVSTAATTYGKQPIENIIVTYDQSTLLTLPRPAAEIIIGNALIADVSVQSSNLLVITGKSFGITNMIVLDQKKEIIFEKRLQVKREEAMVLNLQRGTLRQTYNCTPQCNPTVTVGDDQSYFDAVVKSSEKKQGLSEKASDAGSQTN
jgi:Flp pilus assembly secretin CpaC